MNVTPSCYRTGVDFFTPFHSRFCNLVQLLLCKIAINFDKYLFALGENKSSVNESKRIEIFEVAIRTHEDIISRICFGYARTRDEYDDLRQDVLINLWQGLKYFRGDSSLRTWIYRVTLNTCVSTIRKREKDLSTVSIDSLYDVIEENDSDKEMISELHRCIESLSPTDKAIILAWLEGMSYEEIADLTGLTRNTLATRLKRAKEKIAHIHLNK